MTILNVALGEREVCIITDARQSAMTSAGLIAMPQQSQKCAAFPILNVLLAHSGDAGSGTIARALSNYLLQGIVAGDVLELSKQVPRVLADLARDHKFSGFGRIVLAGIMEDRAHAFLLDAPTWAARAIPQGAWVQPSPLSVPSELATLPDERPPIADLTPPLCAPVFRDSLYTIRLSVEQQHNENPVSCGGTIIESYIDNSLVIRQQVLRVCA